VPQEQLEPQVQLEPPEQLAKTEVSDQLVVQVLTAHVVHKETEVLLDPLELQD